MKNWKHLLTIASLLSVMAATPVYAGGWQWLDQNGDHVKECYYIEDDGSVLKGTTTPDGYVVNEEGEWIVDGVVQTQEETIARSTSASLKAEHIKTSQLDAFEYYLYEPQNATDNMPLILYLHGHGMTYFNNLKEDKYFVGLRDNASKRDAAYVLAPFLPNELDFGPKGMWPGIEPSIMELLNYIVDTYKIDRERIYFIGTSMGADSGVQIIAKNPNVFACMVGVIPFHYKCPMRKWEDGWGECFKTVPTWFLIEDEKEAKEMAARVKEDIIAAGGQAWVDVEEGKDHGQASKSISANKKIALYDWMLSVGKE